MSSNAREAYNERDAAAGNDLSATATALLYSICDYILTLQHPLQYTSTRYFSYHSACMLYASLYHTQCSTSQSINNTMHSVQPVSQSTVLTPSQPHSLASTYRYPTSPRSSTTRPPSWRGPRCWSLVAGPIDVLLLHVRYHNRVDHSISISTPSQLQFMSVYLTTHPHPSIHPHP